MGCRCPEGYHGPVCEYHESEQAVEYSQCKIACVNGGKCRKGAKDTSFIRQFELGPLQLQTSLTSPFDENFEHCVCPDGFVGLRCETNIETCGSNGHICLHGSKCILDGDEHVCECENAFTPFEKYAGKYCEAKSSEVCTESGLTGLGKNNFAFCVNGGKCKANTSESEL